MGIPAGMKNLITMGAKRVVNTKLGLKGFRVLASQVNPENDYFLVNTNRDIVRAVDHLKPENLPKKIDGFEDLAFLFANWRGTRWFIDLDLDEAAFLYRLVHSLQAPQCIEIGRLRGGSTFLLASALTAGGHLTSIDLHLGMGVLSKSYDEELKGALRTLGWSDRVDLIVGDSRSYDNQRFKTDLLFIDGDHTYEGAKADYDHWISTLKPGGHVVYHDDFPGKPGVYRLMREFEADPNLTTLPAPGSMAHFIKRA
jgi:predicted O-methyltransferase YrrM